MPRSPKSVNRVISAGDIGVVPPMLPSCTAAVIIDVATVVQRGEGAMGPGEGAVQSGDERRQLRELLGRIALFRGLPAEALDQMVPRFAPVEAAAREVIVRQGAAGDELYVGESGSLAGGATIGGKLVHLGTLGPGDFFGEMAILRNRPRVATVTATTSARLWS